MAGPVVRLGAQEAAGEGAQLRGQVVLGEALEGPGGEVVDEDAGGGLDRGGSSEEVARVKISTSTPARASSRAVLRTYTFMPPASPVPGCASGEVWTETIATRWTACFRHRARNAGVRR
nr:hypothetical protein GCM10025732_13230 [Glycomyces mayteni]